VTNQANAFTNVIDITHPLDETTPVYPGDPPFKREQLLSIANGEIANMASVSFCLHTGTHLDAPYHVLPDGQRLHEIDPRRFISPALVLSGDTKIIEAAGLEDKGISSGMSVLFKTKRPDGSHAFFSLAAADYLASLCVNLVGTDALSPEPYDATTLPVHHILLSHDVLIVENLNLDNVAPGFYTLVVAPLFITNGDGSPVRALLLR
jgi:arylformamidase